MNTNNNLPALYSTYIHKSFDCRIPFKNGKAYLKSCFGGHHMNKQSRHWLDIVPKNCGDICDIDGYLHIDLRIGSWEPDFNDTVEEIKKALEAIFPQIKSWKEVSFEEVAKA